MKYCVRCGRPLDINARVCGSCGMQQPYIDPSLLQNNQPRPAPQNNRPQYNGPQYNAPQYNGPQYGNPQFNAPQYNNPQPNRPQPNGPQYNRPYNSPRPQAVAPAPVQFPAPNTCALVPVYNRPAFPEHKKGVIPYLVWSLILMLFCNIIGTPIALAASFYALAADAGEAADCEKRLDKASTLCIIATVVDVATLIFLIITAVFFKNRF